MNVFSASSMKGLSNPKSVIGHGEVVRNLALIPIPKVLLLHFGEVDVEFGYYRKFCERMEIDEDNFFGEIINSFNKFIEEIIDKSQNTRSVSSICVLMPQPCPLRDETFCRVTSQFADVSVEKMQEIADYIDIRHAARNKRCVSFNNLLEANLIKDRKIKCFRVDKDMLDKNYEYRSEYLPKSTSEHHAEPRTTFPLWQEKLQNEVKPYRVLVKRRAKRLDALAASAPPVAHAMAM
ncbi:hypothetical protein KHC28_26320 [Ancylobacter sonchi]|uniref:hypothetical protein n=1 Tax=Ancylobacter sonchi TaxID=1937790 RepID=UPI001BD67C95|nr:hypothetical protein [Ancylobacter sonchi]MBS7537169.1 hypothetical protein [Ancylobacter sonchi]